MLDLLISLDKKKLPSGQLKLPSRALNYRILFKPKPNCTVSVHVLFESICMCCVSVIQVFFTFLHTTSYCKLARYVSRLRMSSHTCMPLYVLWVLRRAARMLRNTERAVKTEYLSPRLSLRISVEVPPRYQRCNRSAAKHFMFL